MNNVFKKSLKDIQPSQLYVSKEKFFEVLNIHKEPDINLLKPIPIVKLNDEIIYTDGHTRALVAFLKGMDEVRVFWDEDELDWEAYTICVEWCKKENIYTISDLKNRIIPHMNYETLWLKLCREMQKKLADRRKKYSGIKIPMVDLQCSKTG